MLSRFALSFLRGRLPACLWLGMAIVPALSAARIVQPGGALAAHEWGTFTSVADEIGNAVTWLPLSGAADLPCFVNRLGGRNLKLALGMVRMETPVLYFYTPVPMTLSVRVDFPQGSITEWYPRAAQVQPGLFANASGANANGRIEWDGVEVRPADQPQFPAGNTASHYYAARETDSAPIRVGQQQEKMIFYRGMGNFQVPLQPKIAADGKIEIRNTGADPIPLVILFENRGGSAGYRVGRELKVSLTLDAPELTGSGIVNRLREEMEQDLVAHGLYAKEAHAMVETWRDSWFEEGTRVFYIVPRAMVDSVLPLTIIPEPKQIARVFVGRIEVLSPWMENSIKTAVVTGDVPSLERYGRFLQPFLNEIARKPGRLVQPERVRAFLQSAYTKVQQEFDTPACVQ